jgi:hypothetical protein
MDLVLVVVGWYPSSDRDPSVNDFLMTALELVDPLLPLFALLFWLLEAFAFLDAVLSFCDAPLPSIYAN